MNFVVGEKHLRHAGGLRVVVALAGVQGAQFLPLSFGQFKVKDVQVAGDPLRVGGLGQDNQPILYLKARMTCPAFLPYFSASLTMAGWESRLLSPCPRG